MNIVRRKSKVVKIGDVLVGGSNPIVIQSMTKTRTSDVVNTVIQINQLKDAGCQIVRLAINDFDDAVSLKRIKGKVKLPLVADIHFNFRLAIAAIENGADKIRLNPGNIDKKQELGRVISALKSARIPLRIGLNSGSVKDVGLKKASMSDKLVSSCMSYIKMIEGFKFNDIVISLKANNVLDTLAAYRKISKICNYPLHLGLTATGSVYKGIIKSSVALGALLLDGIEYAQCTWCNINKTLDTFTTNVYRGCYECRKIKVQIANSSPRGTLLQLFHSAKGHTKRREGTKNTARDNSFDIDLNVLIDKYNEQKGLCAYSGIPLRFGHHLENNWKVSLERIDVFKGYVKDNICLICLEFQAADKSVIYKDNTLGNSGWTKDKFQYFLTKVQEKYANENKAEV